MKKLFALIAVTLTLALFGCETGAVKTKLTIKNETGRTLNDVKWQNYRFTEDISDGHHIIIYYIKLSLKVVKEITAGSGYIYFTLLSDGLRTQEVVVVDKGNNLIFKFTDNTIVVETANPGNIGPISEF
jgi:hypothetical protein